MSSITTMRQNDRRPVLVLALTDSAGDPLDLTSASATFTMTQVGVATPKVNAAACTIPTPTNGQVVYSWAAGNTDTVGLFKAEVVITWSSGVTQTFPAEDSLYVEILDDIA